MGGGVGAVECARPDPRVPAVARRPLWMGRVSACAKIKRRSSYVKLYGARWLGMRDKFTVYSI